ncbi:MAG: Asp-tRNA(Asn)/Glu-tRNA(Gln) amidotransferase subunit GatC [Chloroflexota bacterium]|nr:Asp-tRNA(Asn)/Glu-tRNA(Gln) amidotransferase subunit GatC [Chloroflexota bacterium]
MLARLGLSDEEVETLRSQLGQVLEYIEILQGVDTSAVAPTAQVLSHLNVARSDSSRPSLPTSEALANAPGREGEFFRVPAVMEDFEAGSSGGGTGGGDE